MKRRSFLQLGLGLSAIGLAVPGASLATPGGVLQWSSRSLNAMGTSMTLRAAHADPAQAERALDAALADIRHVEDQMSLFRPDSAISQLNRSGELQQPHPDMLEILRRAQDISRRSQGAFDVTVQPLWLAYAQAQRQGRLPSPQELSAARQCVGWRGLALAQDRVRLQRPGMGITLNGIAQGYAADKVRARLHGHGIAHALIDTGEWAALGQPAHAGDWTLGVAHPRAEQRLLTGIAMQGRCLATSADDQCSFSPDLVNHHIFDPRTGRSPQELASVSVLADNCATADALTKVFFAAGFDRALPLAKRWGVDVLVVDKQGRWQASPGVALRQT
jgi:thiamine biosynthesis lipoprotein